MHANNRVPQPAVCAPRASFQSGYILLPVVLVISLVAVIGFLLGREGAMNTELAAGTYEAARASYLAEAGLKHALWQTQQTGCGPYTDLSAEPFGNHSYTTTLTTDLGSTTSYTLSVDQDTWIRNDQPTDNKATDGQLHIRYEGGNIERPMYRYDLSPLPANATILSSTAWFYVSKAHPEGPVYIHLLTADWTESDATWDTMGDNMDSAVLATIPTQPAQDVWVQFNLTAQLQAWVNGQSNYGITLSSTSEGTHGDYASREHGQQPYLEVIVGTPPSSPATLTSDGTLANGVSRTINRNDVVLHQQPPSSFTLQPDAANGKDVFLKEDAASNNYGVSSGLWVESSGSGAGDNSLLQFDLSGIPYGAKITSATLELFQYWAGTPGGTVGIHRVNRDWVEGTQDGASGTGATWNEAEPGTNWTTSGGDFDSTPVGTADINPWTAGSYTWDVTALVQGWISGIYPNQGLIMSAASAGTLAGFRSSDHSTAAERPKLTLTYTCECGSACLATQGAGNILLVVGDNINLSTEDAYKKALFESWGYTVTLIADNANQSAFDTEVANQAVAYVSESVGQTDLGTKLTNAAIGVVNEEGRSNDEFGIASGSTWPVGSTIDVTDTDHYITRVFPAGTLRIYAHSMEGLTVAGTQAPDLQTLADWGGAGSLVVLDTGATSYIFDEGEVDGTQPVAGRRVILPLGREANFNWNYLNNNGRLIVQRAIEWAKGIIDSAQVILLVVLDAANPTAQDAAKKALIESWGYDVVMIEATESQANLDAAVAASDAVYISEEIHSSDLGTKLTNAAIGIVSEEGYSNDELGLSSERGSYVDDAIEITDNAHYITSPFSTGALTITTSNQDLQTVSGTLAPSLVVLADQPAATAGTLGVIEAGSVLWGGGTAAGRRVHLPWGPNDFDFTTLNPDGELLMRRALEWVLGAGPTLVPGPIAHWKLDDGSGPVAVDLEGGHDGTLAGNPIWTTGQLGGALSFDGSNDYINVPHDDNLSLTGGMTFTAWGNTLDTSGAYQAILAKDTPANGLSNYWFGIWNDELVFGFWAENSFREVKTSSSNLQPGTWYHLAASFDNATDEVRLYVDGTEVQVGAITYEPTTETADLWIGHSVDGEYWDGRLDDIRIYNWALSPAEVSTVESVGSGGGSGGGNFRDEFNTDAFNNSNGTLTWGGDWIEVDDDGAGPTTGNAQISGGQLNLDDRPNTGGDPSLAREVNLYNYASATLSFGFEVTQQVDSSDSVVVEISDNGGTDWTELEDFTGISSATTDTRSYNISAHMSANTQIRFRVNNNYSGNNEKFSVDDVDIDVTGGS